jgi:hypothetical protein
MEVSGIAAVLGLPAWHVIDQVIRPQRLEVPLARRETSLVCPCCQPCCSRGKERRSRGLRDFPILERPVMRWVPLRRCACAGCHPRPWEKSATCGTRPPWTERLSPQV